MRSRKHKQGKGFMLKRTNLLPFLGFLVLLIASCSSKRGTMQTNGSSVCEGNTVRAEVHLVASTAGKYDLIVVPTQMSTPGDIYDVAAVKQSNLAYKYLRREVVLYPNEQEELGSVTEQETQYFDLLLFALFTGYNGGLLDGGDEADFICYFPIPGEAL